MNSSPYSTQRWKRLKAAKLRSFPLCEYCRPMRTTPASHVILKKPLTLGGDPWAMSNLASTCSTCRALHVDVEFEPAPTTQAPPPKRSPPTQQHWWNRD